MIKAVLCGALGRMGKSILETAEEDPEVDIIGGVEHPDCIKDRDLGKASGISSYSGKPLTSRLEELIGSCDIIIEFSGNTQAAAGHAKLASASGKGIVIGTTGFSERELEQIKECANSIPLLLSPNMSIGINLLFKLIEVAVNVLKDKGFDIEIMEIHHKFKKDAPSGTAVKMFEIIKGLTEKEACFGRKGIHERKEEEVGIFALRGGDVVGDHTVYFLGTGERIELTHRATSRKTFAKGTIEAVKWLKNKKPGLYSMFDVLGI